MGGGGLAAGWKEEMVEEVEDPIVGIALWAPVLANAILGGMPPPVLPPTPPSTTVIFLERVFSSLSVFCL